MRCMIYWSAGMRKAIRVHGSRRDIQGGVEYMYLWPSKKSDDHSMVPFDERTTVSSDSACVHAMAMAHIDLQGLLCPCGSIVALIRVSSLFTNKI